jgi:hypothetical protein
MDFGVSKKESRKCLYITELSMQSLGIEAPEKPCDKLEGDPKRSAFCGDMIQ